MEGRKQRRWVRAAILILVAGVFAALAFQVLRVFRNAPSQVRPKSGHKCVGVAFKVYSHEYNDWSPPVADEAEGARKSCPEGKKTTPSRSGSSSSRQDEMKTTNQPPYNGRVKD